MEIWHLTLKMTAAEAIEVSATNTLSQDYTNMPWFFWVLTIYFI